MLNQTQKNILLIDMGNSAIKWALSDLSEISPMSREQYPQALSSAFFVSCWQGLEKPSEIVVSCVAPDALWQALEKACDELWGMEVQRVTPLKEGFGVVNAYQDISSLGSDRWCAMLGGRAKTNSTFIVIDAGSALTLDVVNDSGTHLGGYIVPGLSMMKECLGLHTAQVHLEGGNVADSPSLALGQSTVSCVEAGIHLSVVALIEAAFEKEANKFDKCQVFISGGNAEVIAGLLSFKCAIIPALVLNGLSVIATSYFK